MKEKDFRRENEMNVSDEVKRQGILPNSLLMMSSLILIEVDLSLYRVFQVCVQGE